MQNSVPTGSASTTKSASSGYPNQPCSTQSDEAVNLRELLFCAVDPEVQMGPVVLVKVQARASSDLGNQESRVVRLPE